MVFSSIIFLFLFFPLSIALVHIFPKKFRNLTLTLVSLLFYFWGEGLNVGILLFSIVINYFAANYIGKTGESNPKSKNAKVVLILTIIVNLGMLVAYKYFNFFVDNVRIASTAILGSDDLFANVAYVALPLGISFFTFQALSYTIDVYRNHVKPVRNIIDLACYISMFPQLVAGPIVRFVDIQDRLKNVFIDKKEVVSGIFLFIIGLSKKVLIANTMAIPADGIFAIPVESLNMPLAWLGAIAYSLQIYFDFSGYSDMAIGMGLMFGFRFNENFHFPYMAHSVQDFWRRWHISLSTWFRDYLYIPLGGNRISANRTYFNLLTVFILCGFWHGAQWTFIIWGLYHGAFLALERAGFSIYLQKHVPRVFRHTYALLVIIIGWVIFRTDTYTHFIGFMKAMFGLNQVDTLYQTMNFMGNDILIAMIFGILFSVQLNVLLKNHVIGSQKWEYIFNLSTTKILQSTAIMALFILAIARLSSTTHNPFLYFRF